MAAEESDTLSHPTIRHLECEMLLNPSLKRPKCEAHRRVLHSILSQNEKRGQIDTCAPDKSCELSFLIYP